MQIFINGRFLTQRLTGAQRYALEITKRVLTLRPSNVQVLVPRESVAEPHELSTFIKPIGRFQGHAWEQLELGPYVLSRRGLLWSPTNSGPLAVENQIVTLHDLVSIEHPEWVGKRFHLWYKFLLPPLTRRCQKVLTVSQYSKERIVETLNVPRSKIEVIYNGVGEEFQPLAPPQIDRVREKYRLPERFILTLGSLEPRKNLLRTVEAWEALSEEIRLPLVVAGALGKRNVYGSYSTANLTREGIQHLGYVPDEDLPGLYNAATLFVYASLLEGFGIPPLEALSCGTPTVTSGTTGMKEGFESYALLVDPGNVQSIRAGLEQALSHAPDSSHCRTVSSELRQRFSWDTSANRLTEVFSRYV